MSKLDDPAKLTSLQPSDVIGKEFASVQDAEAFYKNYSLFIGFSIRKDEMRHDRYGMITIRRWVCSKQGYKEQKYMDKTDKKREPRGQTREGCRVAMKIKIERNSMMWVVSEFVIEHTHNLSPPNHTQFLRSHRSVKDSEIEQLQSWGTVGVKTAQVMDHLVDQSGSYSNVGHTKKDLQNRLDSVRRSEIQTSDADSVKSYLTAKSTNVQNGNFTRAFCNCMMNFMTEDEFDLQWFSMVEKFRLNNNEWVSAMYSKRKQWAETFLRDSFFDGMRSTQRCESMNSYLNRFVHCRLKMYEFLKNINRALDRIRNTETFNDYQYSTTTPVYGTHLLGLEKHASQTYTRNVFFLVREEIREEESLSIVNCVQDVDNYTYTFKKFGNANRIWTTRFIPSVNHIHCSCKMFETVGLPCSHSFSVMKAMDMQHISSSLILDRWTTHAKDFSAIKYACEAKPTPIMEKARYGSLSSKCSKMCYFASKSDDGFKEANGEIDKLTVRMQELMPSSPIN
ncbi:hypothetical protein EZV62_001318 [Acer yangbiense]|uniref:SWIM-type domain-containing protein n=1 Tax=Acer yangbiense TaxID=1000413 RepID=A0A5C7IUK0_9ROSI|nr:hypothetical protein EZV62_001318 [Acer yangbiense]